MKVVAAAASSAPLFNCYFNCLRFLYARIRRCRASFAAVGSWLQPWNGTNFHCRRRHSGCTSSPLARNGSRCGATSPSAQLLLQLLAVPPCKDPSMPCIFCCYWITAAPLEGHQLRQQEAFQMRLPLLPNYCFSQVLAQLFPQFVHTVKCAPPLPVNLLAAIGTSAMLDVGFAVEHSWEDQTAIWRGIRAWSSTSAA